jgi:hypothetical protein
VLVGRETAADEELGFCRALGVVEIEQIFGDLAVAPSNLPPMPPNVQVFHENAAVLKFHARPSSDGRAEIAKCFGSVNST